MNPNPQATEPLLTRAGTKQTHKWRGRDITFFALSFIALSLIVPSLVSLLPIRGESADAIRALIGTLAVQLIVIGAHHCSHTQCLWTILRRRNAMVP